MDVEVIRTGRLTVPDAYAVRRPSTRLRQAPCLAFAIRHPTAGVVLVDTGFHRRASEDRRADFGVLMGVFFAGLRPASEPFDEQLRALGIEPDEVERVVMTHLHVDHTSGMRLLPRAEFVCSREEWTAATGPRAVAKGYVGHHLPPASRMRLVDLDDPYGPFGASLDLLGDGSIRLLGTPGHTRGHMSVLVDERILLVGDAAYTLRNIHEQVLPLITADDGRSRRSLAELKAYADANRDTKLVPSHDPGAWKDLL
jgi:glyoxylase-like metal-dependent hydrolase (beta-lactamase superfamily II)